MREAGLDERPLQPRLSPEILQRRLLGRVRDADMDDAPHARRAGRIEQGQRVFHGVGLPEPRVVEPDPVGVVEDGRAAKRISQPSGGVERIGVHLYLAAKRVGPLRSVREGAHADSRVHQAPSDISPGILKGACHDMNFCGLHVDIPACLSRIPAPHVRRTTPCESQTRVGHLDPHALRISRAYDAPPRSLRTLSPILTNLTSAFVGIRRTWVYQAVIVS